MKKSEIPSDYIVYLQETDYNAGAANYPERFSQAMSCRESKLWYEAMKDELNSMVSNGANATGCKWVFKTKTTYYATLRDINQDSQLKDSVKWRELIATGAILLILKRSSSCHYG